MNVLDVRAIVIRRGPRLVVEEATFVARPGEVLAIMGASGAGKTSILRAVAALDPIVSGTIALGDHLITAGRLPRGRILRDLRRSVGIVFQFHHLFAHMSAERNVSLALVHVQRHAKDDAAARARELLEMLGVGDRAAALPHELSGGEAQRVAIARALAVEPPVLLMDEPTASLDRARRGGLAATLRRLASEARTLVVATHDAEFAQACAGRVVLLDRGRVAAEGTPGEVLA